MSRFISKRLAALDAYVPGEQPSDMQYIKLNTNESPYPPPPGVLRAVTAEELSKQNLYPNPDGAQLITKLAKRYDVRSENVIIGNGSDELLAFAFFVFFSSGAVFPDITYGFYLVYAELYDIPYKCLPLSDDFSINVDDYINTDKNIVIPNPNAPTGIALELDCIESIVKSNKNRLVLIDEAYTGFGAVSAIPLTRKYDNLLVIHTYSKTRSMAGARLAYAIASEPIISDLKKIKYSFNPYNVNRLTQVMGAAALDEDAYYNEKHRLIIDTRDYTAKQLKELGFELTDSKANFLFARNPHIGGEELYLKLKDRGILIRHWNKPRIKDYVRITIGTKAQMDGLIDTISDLL